MIRSE